MDSWFWVLAWLLTITTLLGNGLVIYLITTRRRLSTVANKFVLSLAVADFSFGASFCPSLHVCEVLAPCNTIYRIATISLFALISNANLCTMTLDRYVATVKPLTYTAYMTSRRIRVLICTAWCSPVFVYVLCFITGICHKAQTNRATQKILYMFISYVEVVPCVVLLYATTRILLIARKHGRQMDALVSQLSFNDPEQIKRRKGMFAQTLETSSAKVVAVTVAVFVTCYTIDIYYTSYTEFDHGKPHEILKGFLRLLLITNSATNPLAYAFLKKDIKREIRNLFRRRKTIRLVIKRWKIAC